MSTIKNIFIGIILGVANVIPGVSAGTMAVVMGIYDQLISSISLNKKILKENGAFLLTIVVGAVIGIIIFSKAVSFLITNYPMETNFFFIGIIIGSLPMIYNMAKKPAGNMLKPKNIIPFCITLSIMAIMVLTETGGTGAATTVLTVPVFIQLFLIVTISAVAMIIPGISGSFIMLVLGVYGTVITAVSDFNIPLMIPIAIGVLTGIVGGARAVKYLMDNHPQATYCGILGLVLGSIFTIYPGITMDSAGFISIIIMLIAMIISYQFSKK